MTNLVNDPAYYFDDGDCVIQVEDTLFCVHKVLLKRDSSMFSDMFSIPQAPELHESGGSRDNPLVLVGETPDAFRALCWILYALPSEITSIYDSKNPTPDHVLKFISLVLITHKYGFASLESWGFDFVHRHCISYTDDSFSRVCAVGDLRQLLTMCQLTSDLDFERCRLLEERIGSHILFRALHNNPRFLERADALAISAEFGLRNIEGGMYYRILVEATKLAYETNQDVNYTPFLPTYLTAAQITCIHRGFISLIGVNERFHWDNAEVPCSCELDCSEAARSVLAQVNAKSREDCLLVDVLGQLHYMEEIGNLSRVGAWSGVSTSCEVHILEYIAEINDKVVGALGDYFLGILQPQEAGLQ